jgi:hypothetical protein
MAAPSERSVYLAASITGRSAAYVGAYRAILEHLKMRDVDVLCAHVAKAVAYEAETDASSVYCRNTAWLDRCNGVIAEISLPSLGVGYEVCYALQAGKPVLCLYDERERPSKMILGIDGVRFQAAAYRSMDDLRNEIDKFLSAFPGDASDGA